MRIYTDLTDKASKGGITNSDGFKRQQRQQRQLSEFGLKLIKLIRQGEEMGKCECGLNWFKQAKLNIGKTIWYKAILRCQTAKYMLTSHAKLTYFWTSRPQLRTNVVTLYTK